MFLKIFFDDRPLFLCDKIEGEIEEYSHHDDAVLIDELNGHSIKTILHEMARPEVHAGIFIHNDLHELQKQFFKKFKIVKAGGGLVINPDGAALLIFRRGKWDLPKGKLDKGESMEECALREVSEETGITQIQIQKFLTISYHTYHEGSSHILKESHWYEMQHTGSEQLVPQQEEDIKQAIWAKPADMHAYLQECFPSVRDLLKTWLLK